MTIFFLTVFTICALLSSVSCQTNSTSATKTPSTNSQATVTISDLKISEILSQLDLTNFTNIQLPNNQTLSTNTNDKVSTISAQNLSKPITKIEFLINQTSVSSSEDKIPAAQNLSTPTTKIQFLINQTSVPSAKDKLPADDNRNPKIFPLNITAEKEIRNASLIIEPNNNKTKIPTLLVRPITKSPSLDETTESLPTIKKKVPIRIEKPAFVGNSTENPIKLLLLLQKLIEDAIKNFPIVNLTEKIPENPLINTTNPIPTTKPFVENLQKENTYSFSTVSPMKITTANITPKNEKWLHTWGTYKYFLPLPPVTNFRYPKFNNGMYPSGPQKWQIMPREPRLIDPWYVKKFPPYLPLNYFRRPF